MWLWLVGVALAQDPAGRLAFALSPDATVSVVEQSATDAVEITIRNNHVPLGDQLRGRSATGMLDVAGVSVGGGTWFVTVYLEDPDETLEPELTREGVVFRRVPRRAVLSEPPPSATLADLVNDTAVSAPGRPPSRTLMPLLGGASAAVDTDDHHLPVLPWRSTAVPAPDTTPLAGDTVGWDAVVRFQQLLVATDDAALRQVARYRLALAYDAMALSRESDHYLKEMQADGDQSLAVALLRARAASRLHNWQEMREQCSLAAAADPASEAVLHCYAMLAVETGSPAPGPTGRLLLATSDSPDARVLGVRALLRDHHYDESLVVLRDLLDETERPSDGLLAVWGDTEMIAGRLDDARQAWETVRWNGRWGRLARVRLHTIDLLESRPTEWLERLPDLHVEADYGGTSGAEALQLIAQIGSRYGDPETEATALASLLSRHRQRAAGSDALTRLVESCGSRLAALHQEERFVEEVTLYRRCWHPSLNDVLRDTTTVEAVSDAYSALGLDEAALDVQLEVLRMRSRDDRPDNASTARLARLYNRVGRPIEALQTVEYIRANRPSPDLTPTLMQEAARAHATLGDVDAAIAELERADGEDWDSRAMWAELVSARDGCERARTEFQYQADAGREPLEMAARCLLELGDPQTARRYVTDSAHPAHAAQIAAVSVALDAQELPALDEQPEWYEALAREEEAHSALRQRLGAAQP